VFLPSVKPSAGRAPRASCKFCRAKSGGAAQINSIYYLRFNLGFSDMQYCHALYALFGFLLLSTSTTIASASDFPVYLRGLTGLSSSFDTTYKDVDCSSTIPAAYFGCGLGEDGSLLGAYGDFGQTILLEVGLGVEVTDYLRIEAIFDYRPDFVFDGNANFLSSGANQPVSGEVKQIGMMAFVHLEPLSALGIVTPIRPFIGAGAGASRNKIGEMTYEFPALKQPRYSLMPGGVATSFAWSAVGGVAYDVADRLTLEVSYRYSNLGEVRTDEGILFIQRSSGTREIPIAATTAELTDQSIALSLRWCFMESCHR
jgi:opacity protein-like surface antigen